MARCRWKPESGGCEHRTDTVETESLLEKSGCEEEERLQVAAGVKASQGGRRGPSGL